MTTAAAPRNLRPGPRWHTVQAFLPGFVLIVLLVPVAYLFTQLWASTTSSAATTAAERAAVAYARPVNRLLAALVDTQYTAVRRTTVDPAGVRAAVDDVSAVDRQSADALQVRQRWTQLSHEIDNALNQNPSGAEAFRTYAAPIALTQALAGQIADASRATRDPGPGSYQLTQVALRSLPDVVVNAGQVSALALATDPPVSSATRPTRPATTPDPELTVAADRLARAADDVSTGLRAGTGQGDNYSVSIGLLGPLDEFVAAADELRKTAAGLEGPDSGGARNRIDAANTLVKTKALALETAVLNAFDAQLTAHTDGYAGQRRTLLLAAVIIVLAATALLLMRVRRPAVPRADAPGGSEEGISGNGTEGRHSHPAGGHDDAGPDGSPRTPDPVGVRGLLPRLMHIGSAVRVGKRHDRDDHR